MTHAVADNSGANALCVGMLEGDDDASALMRILESAFGMQPRDSLRYEALVGRENFRVLRDGATVVGGLAIINMGQYFGGQRVSMAGIAAVGIAPWMRGRGAARTLMTGVLQELRDKGVAISSLYPATQTLYRATGYEVAGSQYEITMPLDGIGVNERSMTVRPIAEDDEPAINTMHTTHAALHPGNLARNDVMWQRIRMPRGKPAAGFAFERDGQLEGYVYYTQKGARGKPYSLHVNDMLVTTPAAARRVLAFLAEHRSVGMDAIWMGSPMGPILASLPENAWKIRLNCHWMTRIVNVKTALEARGFASCAAGEVHLDVTDDVLSANAGQWIVRISAGKATVEAGGSGAIRISARALAPLYTGFMSAHDLSTLGWLEARDQQALTPANNLFASPMPWMSDGF